LQGPKNNATTTAAALAGVPQDEALDAIRASRLELKNDAIGDDIAALFQGIRHDHRNNHEAAVANQKYLSASGYHDNLKELLEHHLKELPTLPDVKRRGEAWDQQDNLSEIDTTREWLLSEPSEEADDTQNVGGHEAKSALLARLEEVRNALHPAEGLTDNLPTSSTVAGVVCDLWNLCKLVHRNNLWKEVDEQCGNNKESLDAINRKAQKRKDNMKESSIVAEMEDVLQQDTDELRVTVASQLQRIEDEVDKLRESTDELRSICPRLEQALNRLIDTAKDQIALCAGEWQDELNSYHKHNAEKHKEIRKMKKSREGKLTGEKNELSEQIASMEAVMEVLNRQLREKQSEANVVDYQLGELRDSMAHDIQTLQNAKDAAVPVERDLSARTVDASQEMVALDVLHEAFLETKERMEEELKERGDYTDLGKRKFAVNCVETLSTSLAYLHGVFNSKKKKVDKLNKKRAALLDEYATAQDDEDTAEINHIESQLMALEIVLAGAAGSSSDNNENGVEEGVTVADSPPPQSPRQSLGAEQIKEQMEASLQKTSKLIEEVLAWGGKATGVYEALCQECGGAAPRWVSADPSQPPQCYVIHLPGREVEMLHPLPVLELKVLKQQSVLATDRVNKIRLAMKEKEEENKALNAAIQAREQTILAIKTRADLTPRDDTPE